MAFYLRKGFNFGPIRINLSKSGLGLSAGVTGARIGINSRGQSYIHGGRHGLYYRKNLGSVNSSRGHRNDTNQGNWKLDDEEIYTDTGLTYLPQSIQKPEFTLPPLTTKLGKATLFLGIALIIVALFSQAIEFKIGIGLLGAASILWNRRANQKVVQIEQVLEKLIALNPSEQNKNNWDLITTGIPEKAKPTLALHCIQSWLESQIESGQIIPINQIQSILNLDETKFKNLVILIYKDIVEEVLADHQLTEEEEKLISEIESKWGIVTPVIQEEKKLIAQFKQLRELQFEPLTPIVSEKSFSSDEALYFESEGRLLNLRILDSWQQNRIRYKNMGYKLDIQGILRLTDKSISIEEGRNIRTYPIRQVEDIYLSSENGVVEVFLHNRKSPLIITCPNLFKFAAILNKIIEE